MYAVIKTGGKQYRVQPGDVLVVEKLAGDPGDAVSFDQVLMLGDGDDVFVGAPLVDGGLVSATLVETRKGEKVRIFKKKRRQGYRRTKGHRQTESVLRVTGIAGSGKESMWEGQFDLTPRSVLQLRARNLASRSAATGETVTPEGVEANVVLTETDPGPVMHATVVEHAGPAVEETAAPAAKKPRAKKAAAADEGALVEQPISETPADAPQTVQDAEAQAGTGAQEGTEAPPAKKPRAKKAPAADAAPEDEQG